MNNIQFGKYWPKMWKSLKKVPLWFEFIELNMYSQGKTDIFGRSTCPSNSPNRIWKASTRKWEQHWVSPRCDQRAWWINRRTRPTGAVPKRWHQTWSSGRPELPSEKHQKHKHLGHLRHIIQRPLLHLSISASVVMHFLPSHQQQTPANLIMMRMTRMMRILATRLSELYLHIHQCTSKAVSIISA